MIGLFGLPVSAYCIARAEGGRVPEEETLGGVYSACSAFTAL